MFERRLKEANLPIRISGVKKSKFVNPAGTDSRDPIYAIARGCLIAALTKEASLIPEAQETQAPKFQATKVHGKAAVAVGSGGGD